MRAKAEMPISYLKYPVTETYRRRSVGSLCPTRRARGGPPAAPAAALPLRALHRMKVAEANK